MSLRFPYKHVPTRRPAISLAGQSFRPRPIITVSVLGPRGTKVERALVDSGADDTVFHQDIAAAIGIDLSNAPVGEAGGVGMARFPIRYAEVTLRVTNGRERREWRALVGFTSAPLHNPLLGYAGCLQYFTATFHGDREEVELAVNGHYPGT
jgi:hypothetical protein